MYYQVANKLVVTKGTDQFSQAVSMTGGNAVKMDATGFYFSAGGTLQVALQEGNDLDNWSEVSGSTLLLSTTDGTLTALKQITQIASQYVRLKFTTNAAAGFQSVVAAGINVANL